MDEQTGTDDSLFNASDVEAIANDSTTEQAENTDGSAVEVTNEQTDSQEEAIEEPAVTDTQTGDAIDEFLAKKGIDRNDPDALRKVADMYRNVEKEFGKKSQEKAQLERQLEQMSAKMNQPSTSNDPLERVAALERQLQADRQIQAVKEWKQAKNLSPEVEGKMIDYLSQQIVSNGVPQTDNAGNPLTRFFALQNGIITLDDVFSSVGGDSLKADAIKQELKTAVANEIAAKQNAKSPASLATNSTQFAQPKTADDDFAAGLLGD